jgi:hypothetical protein
MLEKGIKGTGRQVVTEKLTAKEMGSGELAVYATPAMITGWFGMNFVNMPELQSEWGYPVIIAASILLVAGLLWFFRHKKWL